MKTFKSYEKTTIKNAAKSAYPLRARIEKINKDIAALEEEKHSLDEQIDRIESSVVNITGGYTSLDLVERTVNEITKEDGTVTKSAAQYNWKYPETIIPPEEKTTTETTIPETEAPIDETTPSSEPTGYNVEDIQRY
jgi:exonuclease VII small subunit